MTRMIGPECAVIFNLINAHTRARAHARTHTSSVAIIFCCTAGPFIPHVSLSLQTGSGACGHRTAPFARPGVCTRAVYRGDNRVRGTERSERVGGGIKVGNGNRDGNGIGGGNGDANGDGDGNGAGTGTEVEASEQTQDGNGDGSEDGAGTGTITGVETRGKIQNWNGDGSWDVNESRSGDENGKGDGKGDGKEDGIGDVKGTIMKREGEDEECSGIRLIGKEAK